MSTLLVRRPGICSTLQDAGRRGYRAYGVPTSGALDPVALSLVNALVGNAADCAAIEMLYSGVSLQAQGGSVRLAVCGADATIAAPHDEDRTSVRAWRSVTLQSGETFSVGRVHEAATAYVAVEGGFQVAPVLGSVSTYLRGGLGGWHGRALRAGDALPLVRDAATLRAEQRYSPPPTLHAPDRVRIITGPQAHRFEQSAMDTLLEHEYFVSPSSDRAGLRLAGPALRHVGGHDANSEGVAPGSIQVPGSGLPVILIGDHPTVGGYPKIATIISADLAAAGRLRIGSRIRFDAVSAAEAARARERLRATIRTALSGRIAVGE